jgi:TolA-binding protein
MPRNAAIIVLLLMVAAVGRGVATAQTPPSGPAPANASSPATAADVAALRQSLEQLHAQLAALSRRISVREQEINELQSR